MKRLMKRLSTPAKLTLCVVSLLGSELMVARIIGLVKDHRRIVLDGRSDLCESIAINFSLLAMRDDVSTMRTSLQAVAARNENIESLAVRKPSGELLVDVGNHHAGWMIPADGKSTSTHMLVPISSHAGRWGTVEVRFKADSSSAWGPILGDSFLRLLLFMGVTSLFVFYLFFVKILKQLNPSKAIPGRVRSALDTLTEGLLILDADESIVLANLSFSQLVGRSPDRIIGMKASELPWRPHAGDGVESDIDEFPWNRAFDERQSCTGNLIDFQVGPDERRTLLVNASPVFGAKGRVQGVLTSLDDVTPLEQKKRELNVAIDQLHFKSEEIRQQNEELQKLATTDPLTECLNRRSFFGQFEGHWAKSTRHNLPLSCVMVDIDFFKSINDDHGHSMGDEVLKDVAGTLREKARVGDLVCRFGGEEFCVLMPHTDTNDGVLAAERFRVAIEASKFPKFSITASFGVSSLSLGAADPHELLDQADKCLYVAKRNGRNQVVRFDDVPVDLEVDESQISRTKPAEPVDDDYQTTVPYRAVAALLSTLTYRHAMTASHSRRVADLCVTAAEGLMSPRHCYLLEVAALLHDIGKMGVPDAILLKAGPLTSEEWEIMRRHDRIGVEIVRASFDCPAVTEIVETYRAYFGGTRNRPGLPTGEEIPIGARVLAIVDAYDSMTTDRPYRVALSCEDAFAELRQCAGSQFDPVLVERFIVAAGSRRVNTSSSGEVAAITRDTALDIGQQIERLVDSLETQDMDGMKSLAERLQAIARQDGLDSFAEKAGSLHEAIVSDSDLLDILSSANDLIDLCRQTHSTWLRHEATEV